MKFFSNLKIYQIIYIKITRWLVDVSTFLGIHLLFLGLTKLNMVFWERVSGQTPLAAGGQGEGGLQLPLWLSTSYSMFPSPSENTVCFSEEGQGHKLCWPTWCFRFPAVVRVLVSGLAWPGLSQYRFLVPLTFCNFSSCFYTRRKKAPQFKLFCSLSHLFNQN